MLDLFLRAARNEPVERVPVWFMRQAGRSLPEYRALRERHSILEICDTPDLAVEVTMQPVRRLGVDAAILFSDIVVPLRAMGVDLDITPGKGPVIASPVRTVEDVAGLEPLELDSVKPVTESVRSLVAELDVPLIGFAGAPFTLASYLIEGGASRTFARTKEMMLSDEIAWSRLMSALADATVRYLRAQIDAGVSAVQLFDSWAGALSRPDYERYVLPASRKVLQDLKSSGVPLIHFGVGTGELLDLMADAGADVLGVDWRVPLDAARARLKGNTVLQGNLDPAVCLAPWPVVDGAAKDVLRRGGGRGHIFNLGHGVLPETDPSTLQRLVELVHSESER